MDISYTMSDNTIKPQNALLYEPTAVVKCIPLYEGHSTCSSAEWAWLSQGTCLHVYYKWYFLYITLLTKFAHVA